MTQSSKGNRKRRRWIFLAVFLAGFLGVIAWVAWGNTALVTTELSVKSEKLPAAFDGFRIVQVSDLHNASFGEGNAELLEQVEQAQPDCIALTGDLVDSRHTDVDTALSFAREAAKIAPTYFVTGNHEARLADLEQLLTGLEEAGVTILQNESILLEREGQSIVLAGVEDPSFHDDPLLHDTEGVFERNLESLSLEEGRYTILLSHRPEYFAFYEKLGFDLVLTGHAHGGQFRLPGIGGLWAPGQGLFPKYDAGLYQQGGTAMAVSRGLGNSLFPFRVNNRPEIVAITLQAGE